MNFLQTKAKAAKEKLRRGWGLILSASTQHLTPSQSKKNQEIEGSFVPPYLRGGEPQQEFLQNGDTDEYENVTTEGGFNYNAGVVL